MGSRSQNPRGTRVPAKKWVDPLTKHGGTIMNTLLKFEITATWNCKLITANCSLRFAFSHEKPNAKCLYDDVCKRQTLIYTTWPSFSFTWSWRLLFNFFLNFTKIARFTPILSIRIVLNCFYLLISHENFSRWISRLAFAVNAMLLKSLY